MSDFKNVYEKADYAEAYAGLGWTGTYLLVERDLPGILSRYVTGRRALDFGCGTGRSSRLLRDCGFEVTGVDVSTSMVEHARMADPTGDYRLLEGGDLTALPAASFDLVLAAFPFDNIPAAGKEHLLGGIARLLATNGRFVNIVSSPEIYIREWASFSTRAWPENLEARDGDIVRIVTRGFESAGPAEDVLCTEEAYADMYARQGLQVEAIFRPLAHGDEGVAWESETRVAPWVIWVLRRTCG
jgi:ubiquinone/menaquinone biosynthesis C-methylase UbiE